MLEVSQAAARCKLSPETIRRAIRDGELEALQFGSVYRIPEGWLADWIERHRTKGPRALAEVRTPEDGAGLERRG